MMINPSPHQSCLLQPEQPRVTKQELLGLSEGEGESQEENDFC